MVSHARCMLRAALLDVGGTLWPERLPPIAGVDPRVEPLSEALPSLEAGTALAVIRQYLTEQDASLEQRSHARAELAFRSEPVGGIPVALAASWSPRPSPAPCRSSLRIVQPLADRWRGSICPNPLRCCHALNRASDARVESVAHPPSQHVDLEPEVPAAPHQTVR
jgi:hypothetical protein